MFVYKDNKYQCDIQRSYIYTKNYMRIHLYANAVRPELSRSRT